MTGHSMLAKNNTVLLLVTQERKQSSFFVRSPKLLLAFLNLESCVIDRNTNFPGVHVKKVMQMKPIWRILLVSENAITSCDRRFGK